MTKRVFAILLVAIMLVAALPLTTYAATNYTVKQLPQALEFATEYTANVQAATTKTVSYEPTYPEQTWHGLNFPDGAALGIPVGSENKPNFKVTGLSGDVGSGTTVIEFGKERIYSCVDVNKDGYIDAINFNRAIKNSGIDYWDITFDIDGTKPITLEEMPLYSIEYNGKTIYAYALEPEKAQLHYAFGNIQYQEISSAQLSEDLKAKLNAELLALVKGTELHQPTVVVEDPDEPVNPSIILEVATYEALTPTISWKTLNLKEAGVLIPKSSYEKHPEIFKTIGMQGDVGQGAFWHDYTSNIQNVSFADEYIDTITFKTTINDSSIDYWNIEYAIDTNASSGNTITTIDYEAKTPTISWSQLNLYNDGVRIPAEALDDAHRPDLKLVGMQGDISHGEFWYDYTNDYKSHTTKNGYVDTITFSRTINDSSIDYWQITYSTGAETLPAPVVQYDYNDIFAHYATQAVIYEMALNLRGTNANSYFRVLDQAFINAVGHTNEIGQVYSEIDAFLTATDADVVSSHPAYLKYAQEHTHILQPLESNQPVLVFFDTNVVEPSNARWLDVKGTLNDIPAPSASATNYNNMAIYNAIYRGYLSGTSSTQWSPNMYVSRAQFVTILYRLAGSPTHHVTKNPFKDVRKNTWYYDAVMWAVENNITAGTSATTFSPNNNVTKEQMATFLYRYGKDMPLNVTTYTDAAYQYTPYAQCKDCNRVAKYAKLPMQWLNDNHIGIPTYLNKRLYPKSAVKRSEFAYVIYQLTNTAADTDDLFR